MSVPFNRVRADDVDAVASAFDRFDDENELDPFLRATFREAVASNAIEVGRYCIKHIDNPKVFGQDLLDVVSKGSGDFVEMTLREGLDPNAVGSSWITHIPLIHEAIGSDRRDNLRLLIGYGGDINICDPDGNTPLHVAVNHENSDMVREVLDLGGDFQVKNANGSTPWDLAIRCNCLTAAETLQRHQELQFTFGSPENDQAVDGEEEPNPAPGVF